MSAESSSSSFVPGSDWQLVSQGAEARLWKCTLDGRPTIVKERFSKAYRHPILDEKLIKQRTRTEARLLEKCAKHKLNVPTLYKVHYSSPKNCQIYMEYIQGETIRQVLQQSTTSPTDHTELSKLLGALLGNLHKIGIVHGDLTTSNMIYRNESIVLIDFGLSKNTESVEERAVDLYVLERALQATHPDLPETFWKNVLGVYEGVAKDFKHNVLARLDQVRQRGRKRECFG